jgi:hypothetical protein
VGRSLTVLAQYASVARLAGCGASTLSVRHRIYELNHLVMRFMKAASSNWRTKMHTVYNTARHEDTLSDRKNGGDLT